MNLALFKKYAGLLLIFCLFFEGGFALDPSSKSRKTVLVTCASGELGGAAAQLLAKDYDLILTARDEIKLKKLQEELSALNSCRCHILALDYQSSPSRSNFYSHLKQIQPSIAGMVLITPRPEFIGKTLMQEEKHWLEVFQNTFTGPVEVLKNLIPYFNKPSKIVIIAGLSSVQFQPEYGPSGIVRRMWTTFAKGLSHEVGPQGISVNVLSPAVVLTNFHKKRIENSANKNGVCFMDQMHEEVSHIPLRRHAELRDVAQAIQFLLSEKSDFINGINLILDGGSSLVY